MTVNAEPEPRPLTLLNWVTCAFVMAVAFGCFGALIDIAFHKSHPPGKYVFEGVLFGACIASRRWFRSTIGHPPAGPTLLTDHD